MEQVEINLIIFSLVPQPIGYDGKSGGTVRLIEILKRLNIANRAKIVFVCTPFMKEYFENAGISADYRIVNSNSTFKNLFSLGIKSVILISRFLFSSEPKKIASLDEKTVIYSSSDLFWEVIPAYYLKLKNKNIKWIQVIHHTYPDWKKRAGNKLINFFGFYLQRFSLWLIKKKSDKIIVLNYLVRDSIVQMGFPPNKIYLSYNGINFDYIDKIEKAQSVYEGVFLGRLSPSKGISDLIEIWKNVCLDFSTAKLAIIGGSDKKAKLDLIENIKANELDKNIDFLGYLEDHKAFAILKSAKVFLFPSHEEGWGIAIAEAMACGLPVVSWNLPVYKSVFKNYTIQIEENNIKKISGEIVKLLKSDNMRAKIAKRGKEFVKKYSWDSVAKREFEIMEFMSENM